VAVLEEDQYLATMSHIIQRDFFPALPSMEKYLGIGQQTPRGTPAQLSGQPTPGRPQSSVRGTEFEEPDTPAAAAPLSPSRHADGEPAGETKVKIEEKAEAKKTIVRSVAEGFVLVVLTSLVCAVQGGALTQRVLALAYKRRQCLVSCTAQQPNGRSVAEPPFSPGRFSDLNKERQAELRRKYWWVKEQEKHHAQLLLKVRA
jgi:hypothetical protein